MPNPHPHKPSPTSFPPQKKPSYCAEHRDAVFFFVSLHSPLPSQLLFLFATIQRRLGPPRRVFVFASPFKVLHLLSLQMGWGSSIVWVCFWFRVFGNLCSKTARNAAPFSLSCVCWESGLLSEVVRKVLLV